MQRFFITRSLSCRVCSFLLLRLSLGLGLNAEARLCTSLWRKEAGPPVFVNLINYSSRGWCSQTAQVRHDPPRASLLLLLAQVCVNPSDEARAISCDQQPLRVSPTLESLQRLTAHGFAAICVLTNARTFLAASRWCMPWQVALP